MINNYDPDIGGGRGYSLSFADQNSYASICKYFSPSNQWPVNAVTLSMWIRWIGMTPGGIFSSPLTLLAKGDTNHFQLAFDVGQLENDWISNIFLVITSVPFFSPVRNLNTISSSWTHLTVTLNLTGMWLVLYPISQLQHLSP